MGKKLIDQMIDIAEHQSAETLLQQWLNSLTPDQKKLLDYARAHPSTRGLGQSLLRKEQEMRMKSIEDRGRKRN